MDEEIRVCSMCGCELQENETVEVDGEAVCDECAEQYTTTCDHCGETIWAEDAVTDEHMNLCSCCFDDHYRRCENCGRLVHDNDSFAFAHNGVLYNEAEMQKEYSLPETPIETDSYTAVQVLETFDTVDYESVKAVSEAVRGSFVFTILRDDNTLFLVKGDNPLTVYCYPELGLYVYASTKEILDKALKLSHIKGHPDSYRINEGNIIRIDPEGKSSGRKFEMKEDYRFDWRSLFRDSWMPEDDICSAEILDICGYYGIEKEDVEQLLSFGYTVDEIEEMLTDTDYYESALAETKAYNSIAEEV